MPDDSAAKKYVCIHGHFYQPPRENPWLEIIEKEDSAAPYHDWDERINFECYRANTAARLVDDRNRILDLRNNYRSMSFNFGPTLLRWIERHDPWVYQALRDADRDSCERFQGHGNAMAQAYNHLIMPLANRRDKLTQVLWGIRDFEHRFGRRPEGMWLPETAVDRETLDVMAKAGIRFTILSPHQAARWRFLGETGWNDARGGNIPSGRAYRYECGEGRSIHLFFYDASLARGVAFERLLEHSSRFVGQIDRAYRDRNLPKPEPWLVNVATDGESYGHHFKFGDMALAAAFQEMERNPSASIVNYAAFLNDFPVRAQVEILENSAWSCAHGLGRWQEDCSCHIGGEPHWNQKWRRPLRAALNRLRDTLDVHYEREMGRLSKDPWKARNEYIEVLLNPKLRAPEFVQRHAGGAVSGGSLPRFFQLLEMQACAMSMFTSCGWFFDEVSGLESVLILRYAARAIQLAEQTGAASPEPSFLQGLEKAPSNLPEYGNGANVFLKKVKPEVVKKDRVLASYAIQSLVRSARPHQGFYSFNITPLQEENLGTNPVPCLFGQILVKDRRTLEEDNYLYAVLHFGALDFRCSVKPFRRTGEYESILRSLQESVEEQNTVKIVRTLDEVFGTAFFSLQDVFRDLRSSIALEIGLDKVKIYNEFQRHMYQTHRPLMWSMRQLGVRLPTDLRGAVRRALSDEIDQIVHEILTHENEHEQQQISEEASWKDTDFFYRAHVGHLHSLLEDARSWGVALQLNEVTEALGHALVSSMGDITRAFTPQGAGKILRLLNVCHNLRIAPQWWQLQTLYNQLIQKGLKNKNLAVQIQSCEGFLNEMDRYLGCRFARTLDEFTKSLVKGTVYPLVPYGG